MFLKSLFLLISLIEIVFSTDTCVEQNPCKCIQAGGQVIDLSSVGSPNTPRFYEMDAVNSTDRYSYNPCFAFNSPDKGSTTKEGNHPCTHAAACVKTPGGSGGEPPEEHSIGSQSTAKFSTSSDFKGYYINYTVEGSNQTLTVKLVCNNATNYHLTVDSPETEDDFNILMTLTTKCACPGNLCASTTPKEPSGLSTGSKLLIAFFTLLLAYFLVGIVWNFCNGAQGVEVVPNLDFWNDLPKLVIEGIAFTCTCCGRRKSYGEV